MQKIHLFKKTILFLLLMVGLAVCGTLCCCASPAPKSITPPQDPRMTRALAWADSVASGLTLRQQVGQLLFPRLDVKNDAAGRRALAALITGEQIGGFLLGKGTLADYKGLIDYAQGLSPIPLMVTLDGEWGLAMRITDAPRFPRNMALGAVRDTSLLRLYGEEVARECRELGISVNFAPVLDVNSNAANPVIGDRSFGEDPGRVSALGIAYSRGLEQGGVMSVAKHFPGHGDTSKDSHKELPTVSHSRSRLDEVDLLPFKGYIHAGMSGVMVGHLNVPALDPSGTPASLSAPITTGLLRGELGFRGLVWTDALAMKGAGSKESNCVRALKAGADVLLQPLDPAAELEAVLKAVQKGELSPELIRERCVKVLAYKRLFPSATSGDASRINVASADAINRRLSEAVVTVLRNHDSVIPLTSEEMSRVVIVTLGAKDEAASAPFVKMCRRYADCTVIAAPEGSLTDAALAKIKSAETVIMALYKQNNAVENALRRIHAAVPRDAASVAVCFLNPYKMARMKEGLEKMDALVATFDLTPMLQECAAEVVFGGAAATGRLPVNLKGWFKMGAGTDTPQTRLGYSTPAAEGLPANLTATYDKMIREAIAAGAFPGCQVLVAKNGKIVLDEAYGALNPKGTVPVNRRTLFDVASVSKVAGTLSALMRAYDKGRFRLDDPISRFIPELRGTDKEKITMRELLLHESGLPAMLSMPAVVLDTATFSGPPIRGKAGDPYTIRLDRNAYGNKNARLRTDITAAQRSPQFPYAVAEGIFVGDAMRDTILSRIAALPLKTKCYRYSDLNFELLGRAVERMEGRPLDSIVEKEVFRPIGATHTMYNPLSKGADPANIAPTERDAFLRRQHLKGYVHDEMAAFSGGVAGNAGLFTTAEDLSRLAMAWLDGGSFGDVHLFKPSTISTFTGTRSADGRRALGFDTSPGKSGKGSPRSFGHTGFTGTQVKVDPDAGLIFIFLSNRVNPTRENAAFTASDIRNRLWSALYPD